MYGQNQNKFLTSYHKTKFCPQKNRFSLWT